MVNQLVIMGISFLVCLIIASAFFAVSFKNDFLRENLLTAAVSSEAAILVAIVPLVFFFWVPYDFVAEISVWRYVISPFAALLILISLLTRQNGIVALAVLAASSLSVLAGDMHIIFFSDVPELLNKILTIIALWIFASGWKAVSGLNPLPQAEGITICGGILILYLLGLAPFILGLTASGILAILIIAHIRSAKQPFSIGSSPFLGFIIGWLGLVCAGEYLLPCFIIFSLFYLLEFSLAFLRKITFLPQYRDIAYNTASLQTFAGGLPAAAIIRIIWGTNILMLFFGLAQVNSDNSFSIPFFAGLIGIWQIYRLLNWQQPNLTLKETNQEIVKTIKSSVNNLFSGKNKKNHRQDKS